MFLLNVIAGKTNRPGAGDRIVASVREAADWAERKPVPVRVSTVEVPVVDVREVRRKLGLSQAAFAAKYGFTPSTLRNWGKAAPARMALRAFYSR